MDFIIGIFGQFLWPILLGLGALLGAWGWGKKKQREGRELERRRAAQARADAAANAKIVRDRVSSEPIDEQRKGLAPWER